MSQDYGLDLKDVVCHLPGRDTSLRSMYASHGIPMEASTDGKCKKFAITITKCQWAKCVHSSIVIDVRILGDKDRPTFSEMFWNGTSFQQILVSVKKELRCEPSPPAHL